MTGLHAHWIASGEKLNRYGFLVGSWAHYSPQTLYEHPLGCRRREVHDDRGTRFVPAFGEEVRVAEHVDLADCELFQHALKLTRRSLTRYRRGPNISSGHLVGEGVRLSDGCRVGNPRQAEWGEVF